MVYIYAKHVLHGFSPWVTGSVFCINPSMSSTFWWLQWKGHHDLIDRSSATKSGRIFWNAIITVSNEASADAKLELSYVGRTLSLIRLLLEYLSLPGKAGLLHWWDNSASISAERIFTGGFINWIDFSTDGVQILSWHIAISIDLCYCIKFIIKTKNKKKLY